MGAMMADVFISYSKQDRALAERVDAALQAAGYSTWWDYSLTPYTSWPREIEDQVRAARAVFVIWTPNSVGSDWVGREARVGRAAGKLVPGLFAPCDIPLEFNDVQYADLTRWTGGADHAGWADALKWIGMAARAEFVASAPPRIASRGTPTTAEFITSSTYFGPSNPAPDKNERWDLLTFKWQRDYLMDFLQYEQEISAGPIWIQTGEGVQVVTSGSQVVTLSNIETHRKKSKNLKKSIFENLKIEDIIAINSGFAFSTPDIIGKYEAHYSSADVLHAQTERIIFDDLFCRMAYSQKNLMLAHCGSRNANVSMADNTPLSLRAFEGSYVILIEPFRGKTYEKKLDLYAMKDANGRGLNLDYFHKLTFSPSAKYLCASARYICFPSGFLISVEVVTGPSTHAPVRRLLPKTANLYLGATVWHPSRDVLAQAYSPEERQGRGGIEFIDAETLERLVVRELEHTAFINNIDWSCDGRFIATGSEDGTCVVWDLETDTTRVLRSHTGVVETPRFSPDGQRLATFGSDGVILWDTASGQKLAYWQGKISNKTWSTISNVPMSPDARMIATVNNGALEVRRLVI